MDMSKLLDALKSANAVERAVAAESLAQAGEQARAAAVSLVRTSGDEDEEVSNWSVAALEELGPPHESDQPALIELLASKQELTAYWAATLLGRLGPQAEQSCQSLARTALQHPQPAVRQRAVWALGKTKSSSEATVQALRLSAQSPDARLARLASRALERVGQ